MSELTLLFESETIRLIRQSGADDASEVWVTFSAFGKPRPMAQAFLERRGVPAFHLISKIDAWYLDADVPAAVAVLRRLLDVETRRIIVLSSSMGGFGALLYSRQLRPDLVVVANPQVVVDRDETLGIDERYEAEWKALATRGLRGDVGRSLDPTLQLIIIYDPFDLEDVWHIGRLDLPEHTRLWRLPFSGHELFPHLAKVGLWPAALEAAAEGSDAHWAQVARAYRPTRREHYAFHFAMGQWLFRRGRFAEAELRFRDMAQLRSDLIYAYSFRSICLEKLGRLDDAVAVLEDGIEQAEGDDRFWWLYQRLGQLHVKRGDVDGAERALLKGTHAFSARADMHSELGRFLLEHRRNPAGLSAAGRALRRAGRLLRSAQAAEPDSEEVSARLADVTVGRALRLLPRRPELARDLLERARHIVPGNIDAHHGLGLAYSRLGDPEAAAASLERGIIAAGRDDRYWWLFQVLANLRIAQTDIPAAKTALQRGIAHYPHLPDTHAELGKLQMWWGRTRAAQSSAARHLRRAVALSVEAPDYQALLAESRVIRARRMMGRQPQVSRRVLETVLDAAPTRVDALLALGDVLLHLGDVNATIEALERALALIEPRPEHWQLFWRLGDLYGRAGDIDRGEAAIARGVAALPDSKEAQAALLKFRIRHRRMQPGDMEALSANAGVELGWDALFDPTFYATHLGPALHGEKPQDHYRRLGAASPADPHVLFDTHWYLSQAGALEPGAGPPLEHFLREGWRKGFSPHPWFDTRYYLAQMDAKIGLDPLTHYLLAGGWEGLDPHPAFSSSWYLNAYPDVAAAGQNPLRHYIVYGADEGRHPHPDHFARAEQRDRRVSTSEISAGPPADG